jgi:hypothetical protein
MRSLQSCRSSRDSFLCRSGQRRKSRVIRFSRASPSRRSAARPVAGSLPGSVSITVIRSRPTCASSRSRRIRRGRAERSAEPGARLACGHLRPRAFPAAHLSKRPAPCFAFMARSRNTAVAAGTNDSGERWPASVAARAGHESERLAHDATRGLGAQGAGGALTELPLPARLISQRAGRRRWARPPRRVRRVRGHRSLPVSRRISARLARCAVR